MPIAALAMTVLKHGVVMCVNLHDLYNQHCCLSTCNCTYDDAACAILSAQALPHHVWV